MPFGIVLAIAVTLGGVAVLSRSIPYGLVLPLLIGWLAAQFATSDAPARERRAVVVVTVWATVVGSVGVAFIPAQLTLVGVGVYVLFRHSMTPPT